jgi:4-diphosphocytidyl-2-C-methyl-D-erythritol kinase
VTVVRAPAKLTRRLRVVGRRSDGYHLLEAEMVTLDLADELEISAGDGLEVIDAVDWVGQEGPPVLAPAPSLLAPDSRQRPAPNLVERALHAVGRSAQVRLRKVIPAGAGLGGGSADAAAVLRWAGCSDLEVAARLGADVPFCLAGGRALVGGVGEIVQPLAYEEADVLLVVPRLTVSTPEVYAAWDSLGGPVGGSGNDLEPAALIVEPRLAWWRSLLSDLAGRPPRLAGSGGTWWLDGDRDVLVTLQEQISATVVAEGRSAVVELVRTIAAS